MFDEKTKLGLIAYARIDIHEPVQVASWCTALGCTEAELRDCVKRVGGVVADVRRYLGR
jgi:hypothetical protein